MVDFRYGWYAQAASGMTYLHQSGILHCNLKADAMYITDDRVRYVCHYIIVLQRYFTKILIYFLQIISILNNKAK